MPNDTVNCKMSLINIMWLHQFSFPLAGLEVNSKEMKEGKQHLFYTC